MLNSSGLKSDQAEGFDHQMCAPTSHLLHTLTSARLLDDTHDCCLPPFDFLQILSGDRE